MRIRFVSGVVVERVGDDVVVLTPSGEAVWLRGDVAEAAIRLNTSPSAVVESDVPLLLATGVVERSDTHALSRRAVVAGGVAATGVGVVSMALPAAAQSISPGSSPGEMSDSDTAPNTNTEPETPPDTGTGPDTTASTIWGNYFAGPVTNVPLISGGTVDTDFVDISVYVGSGPYQRELGRNLFGEEAQWPDDLDPADNWVLLFGGASFQLTLLGSPNEEVLLFMSYRDPDVDDSFKEPWSDDLFDFLAASSAAGDVVTFNITNGTVTVPVSLFG